MSEHRCVSLVPIFAGLDEERQADVTAYAHPRHLVRGQTLYQQGAQVAQLFVVHSGQAKLTQLRPDGHERLLRTVGPGQVVGEHALLTGSRPEHTVTALEPLQVCVFDHAEMTRLTARHPAIAVAMLRTLSQRLADAEHQVTTLTGADVPTRLADYLLSLSGHRVGTELYVLLPLSKQDVASYLGTTPESFSRALARLEGRGVIRADGRRITLVDLDTLSSIAEGGDHTAAGRSTG